MYDYKPNTWWCGSRTVDSVCMTETPHAWVGNQCIPATDKEGRIALDAAKAFVQGWNGDGHLLSREENLLYREAARAILTAIVEARQ